MQTTLQKYIPQAAINYVETLLQQDNLVLKVKQERKTRHGDYRLLPNGKHQITINANLNYYRFLITLIHEIAHLEAYKKYGARIKPHGIEWKRTFQRLMLPIVNPDVFPKDVLPLIAKHFIKPTASSDTDVQLSRALKQFDDSNDNTYIYQVQYGALFLLHNDRTFRRGNIRVKRYECVEVNTGKVYLFNANAEVELL
jgi:hypothetical protein